MPDYLTTTDLARVLKLDRRTVRRAYVTADTRRATEDPLTRRDRALLRATTTPGDYLRWSPVDAVEVVRAFGREPPAAWTVGMKRKAARS